jgi:hypothetical protein
LLFVAPFFCHALLFTVAPCYSPLHFASCRALLFTFFFRYLLPPLPLLLHYFVTYLRALLLYLLCWLAFPPHSFL